MTDYSDLTKQLRFDASLFPSRHDVKTTILRAADAIDDLTAERDSAVRALSELADNYTAGSKARNAQILALIDVSGRLSARLSAAEAALTGAVTCAEQALQRIEAGVGRPGGVASMYLRQLLDEVGALLASKETPPAIEGETK